MLARSNGIASEIVPNGTMVDLTGDVPQIVDHIETGRLYLDGSVKIGAMDGVVRERLRMAIRGVVAVSLVLEGKDVVGVWVEPMGLPEGGLIDAGLADVLETEVERALKGASVKVLKNDDACEDLVHRTVTKYCNDMVGKKPITQITINRLV